LRIKKEGEASWTCSDVPHGTERFCTLAEGTYMRINVRKSWKRSHAASIYSSKSFREEAMTIYI
jgi:hypothetical protein